MKEHIRIFLLALFVSIACTAVAQVSETELSGFKTGKNHPDVEIVSIKVVPLGDDVLQFYDKATGKPLDGDWHLIIHRRRYLTGSIKGGLAQGEWNEYMHPNLYKKSTYRDGKRDGKEYRYNDRGRVYLEELFENGFIRERLEYGGGEVVNRITYDEQGRRHGHFVEYRPSGDIRDETWVHGKLEGERTVTYENGRKTVEHYVGGETSGAYEEWHANGKLREKGFYEPGRIMTGHCVWYDENGDKTSEGDYLHGKRQGEHREYYPGGVLKRLADYDNDEVHGRYIAYDQEPHRVYQEATYVHGRQHGESKLYSGGEPDRVSIYRNGQQICEKVYEKGKIQYILLVDERGSMVRVAEYNPSGQRTYKNPEYKKPPTLMLSENAAGVIDVVLE